jgi:hypothetical protein
LVTLLGGKLHIADQSILRGDSSKSLMLLELEVQERKQASGKKPMTNVKG